MTRGQYVKKFHRLQWPVPLVNGWTRGSLRIDAEIGPQIVRLKLNSPAVALKALAHLNLTSLVLHNGHQKRISEVKIRFAIINCNPSTPRVQHELLPQSPYGNKRGDDRLALSTEILEAIRTHPAIVEADLKRVVPCWLK